MLNSNETKLLKAIAKASCENKNFRRKYGIKTEKSEQMLRPFATTDTYPTSEELDRINDLFAEEFSSQLTVLLEKEQTDEFFEELLCII
ncbi:MAG: hypothetical protein J5647_03845 [Spirochaetaceae bacterium]|nr:hypothetical protein [Spirochaetaceae bacterium]